MSGEEGIFDVVPAATSGTAVSAGGGDFGGVDHPGVVFKFGSLRSEEGEALDVEFLGDAGLVEGGSGDGVRAGSGGGWGFGRGTGAGGGGGTFLRRGLRFGFGLRFGLGFGLGLRL